MVPPPAGECTTALSHRQHRQASWSQGGPVSCSSLAKLDTLTRRHPEQVRGTPNDIAFKFVDGSINVNDLPHHFNDPAAAFVVENFIERTGEMVKINRVSVGCNGVLDQLNGGAIVNSKTRFQNGVKPPLPGLRHFAVDGRYPDEQRCGCEPAILALVSIWESRIFDEA
jgi:hypothetical protein